MACCERKGIANVEDFNFIVKQEDGTVIYAIGGVGITHVKEFEDDIYVEVAGVDLRRFGK
jgi:hypothetical protein